MTTGGADSEVGGRRGYEECESGIDMRKANSFLSMLLFQLFNFVFMHLFFKVFIIELQEVHLFFF